MVIVQNELFVWKKCTPEKTNPPEDENRIETLNAPGFSVKPNFFFTKHDDLYLKIEKKNVYTERT